MDELVRKEFPIFKREPDLVYLDNAATTLKPAAVIEAELDYYTNYSANIHRGLYSLSEKATEKYEEARGRVARLIEADEEEVVFTKGTTESINLVARGWGEKFLKPGDEIVLSQMEHHANLLPWIVLQKKMGVILKFLPWEMRDWEKIIGQKTKILAITQVSNVLGTVNPVKEIIERVKMINFGIVCLVDGAQAVAHLPVSVKDLGADFYAFSGHKMYGPTGIGVLWGKKEKLAETEPLVYGGMMIREVGWNDFSLAEPPHKFEGGTPAIAQAIGLGEAARWLKHQDRERIREEEVRLRKYAEGELKKFGGLKIYEAGGKEKSGIIAFTLEGVHPHDIAEILGREKVCLRAGHHCAMPLHQLLGVEATVRMSLGIYNRVEDIDRLVAGLKKAKSLFVGRS